MWEQIYETHCGTTVTDEMKSLIDFYLSLSLSLSIQLCGAEALWEQIYETHCGTTVTDEMKSLAEEMGWKKMFFTNKLQLQVSY